MKSHLVIIACFITLLLLGTEASGQGPYIALDAPDTMNVGQQYTVTAYLQNNSSVSTPTDGYLDVSFPNYSRASLGQGNRSSGFTPPSGSYLPYLPGDTIYDQTGPMLAQYPLFSAYHNIWAGYEQQWFQVLVTPQSTGTFNIYYRGYLNNKRNPSSSSTIDQQGYYVYVHTVTFVKPDIRVTDIWTEPSEPIAGQPCDLRVNFDNIGNGSAEDIHIEYYINDEYVDDDTHSLLAPGDDRTETETGYIFDSPGTYTYKVVIDKVDGETNTSNNARSIPVTVSQVQYYSISGRLTYKNSPGGCIVGQTVAIGSLTDITNAYGEYTITGVLPGTYDVCVQNSDNFDTYDWWWNGSASECRSVTVSSYDVTGVDFEAESKGTPTISIEGVPSEYVPGEPFDVTVRLRNTNYALSEAAAYLDISVPTVGAQSVEIIDQGSGISFNPDNPYFAGEMLWPTPDVNNPCDPNVQQFPARYVLISGYSGGIGHYSGSTTDFYWYMVRITPSASMTEDIELYVNASIGDKHYPTSGTQNQQGWWVQVETVPIANVEPYSSLPWLTYHAGNDTYTIDLISEYGVSLRDRIGLPLDEDEDADRLKAIRVTDGLGSEQVYADALQVVLNAQSIMKANAEIDLNSYAVRNVIANTDYSTHTRDPWFSSGEYTVLTPYGCRDWWKETFIFGITNIGGLDNEAHRADRYRDVILDAVMQPDIHNEPEDNVDANQKLMQYLDFYDHSASALTVLNHLRAGTSYYNFTRGETHDIINWLKDVARVTKETKVLDYLDALGVAVNVASYAENIRSDVIRRLLLIEFANADAEDRLEALEQLIGNMNGADPALITGLQRAREAFSDVQHDYHNSVTLALDEAFTNGENLVDLAFLSASTYTYLASSPWAAVVLPYALSWQVYKGIRVQTYNAKHCAIAVTLQREIMDSNTFNLSSMLAEAGGLSEISSPQDRYTLDLINVVHYLSYYFYNKYLSISNNTLTSIFGAGQDIVLPGTPYADFIDYLEEQEGKAYEFCLLSSPKTYLCKHNDALLASATDDEYAFIVSKIIAPLPMGQLQAAFSISATQGIVPFTIELTDDSYLATSWEWHIGDQVLTGRGPHQYTLNVPGQVEVYLVVSNGIDESRSVSVTVDCKPSRPNAAFSAVPISGTAPLEVQFENSSFGGGTLSYSWAFGDGQYSNEVTPKHTYLEAGNYSVSLTVANESGSDAMTKYDYVTVDGPKGDITVELNLQQGGFLLSGPATHWGQGVGPTTFTGLPIGEYAVEFSAVQGYLTPASQLIQLDASGSVSVYGEYQVDSDLSAPSAVTDLTAISDGLGILLSWTAPGDDGANGVATHYDIRYATVPITVNNWDDPIVSRFVSDIVPDSAGTLEEVTLHDIDYGVLYYIRLKSADEVPNWSDLSNEATCMVYESVPTLTWTAQSGFDTDGIDPDTGDPTTPFEFRVLYTDSNGVGPDSGFPRLHLLADGSAAIGSPYRMTQVNDEPFETGRIYSVMPDPSVVGYEQGVNYTYLFGAENLQGTVATGEAVTAHDGPIINAHVPARIWVNGNNTSGPGTGTQEDPFVTIQDGIELAQNGDTVYVEVGTYNERINFLGKKILVCSGYILDANLNTIANTMIDVNTGDAEGSTGVTFNHGEDSSSVLCGFKIINGIGTYYESFMRGGGVFCVGASPIIEHNYVTLCDGGAIHSWQGNPVVRDNWVYNNPGWGIKIDWGNGYVVQDNVVEGNQGGGMSIGRNSGKIVGNTVRRNKSMYGTAGMSISGVGGGTVFIAGNVVVWDSSSTGVGGIKIDGINARFINNTIAYNHGGSRGGLVCYGNESLCGTGFCFPANVDFFNNIVAYNSGGGIELQEDARFVSCEYNDVFGNSPDWTNSEAGSSDISCAPEFCDIAQDQFQVTSTSCCANSGIDSLGSQVTLGAAGAGCLNTECCGFYTGGYTGNIDCSSDGLITLSDITSLIDHVYIFHRSLCCVANANVDGSMDGTLTLSDITKLIGHVYINHAQTAPCP